MQIRLDAKDLIAIDEALKAKDWKTLTTNKQRFVYQKSVGANNPQFWEIMNYARKQLGKPEYHNRAKIEKAEEWLKINENHPKYQEALARYEAMKTPEQVIMERLI